CKSIIIKFIDDFHKDQPYQKSMKGEELKEKSNFNSNWFEFVLSDLISKEEVKQIQAGYALTNYGIELSGKDQQKAEIIEKLIGSFDYEPITINLLAEESELPTKKVLELLHVLKGQEKVIDIAEGMWSGQLQIDEMKKKLKQYFEKSDKLSVVQFKDITGLTRKSVIPLLEYFDRKKITLRDGNERLKGEAL
ncbi:MAG: SelB C-terminal domain-containing protein, partial [Candidatus Marinimicrobia bacterium]|nr:SelB C-terminal domain-containing protein [Candidatus Neomarinimicrobiota bacterium]